MAYRQSLQETQTQMTAAISSALGEKLDVQWNLTLAANIISANIAYGQMETISALEGVREVVLETRYHLCVVEESPVTDPNTATSSKMIGTAVAYALGYTGAGSRVAIIDTGLNMNHQSFSVAGYDYAMAYNAGAAAWRLMHIKDT